MQTIGVLLPLPFNEPFDYQAEGSVAVGDIVRVPFGREKHIGVVWEAGKTSNLPANKIKPIIEKLPLAPFSSSFIKFINFTAEYNMAFLGLVLKMALSVREALGDLKTETFYEYTGKTLKQAGLKATKQRLEIIEQIINNPKSKIKNPKSLVAAGILKPIVVEKKPEFCKPNPAHRQVKLTDEQNAAAAELVSKVGQGFSVTLLDGVTGSGKTEVYFEAIAKNLNRCQQSLVLVPEISLTSQWLSRFEKRFGVKPAVWHSNLTKRQRIDTYKAVIEGRVQVIVGARSALFLPYQNLGLIVVDESHDHSFKQEDSVNYQGRDMAVVRAKLENFPIILSTATPDLETICNVEEGKYACVELKNRFADALMPEIKIVDLKKDKPVKTPSPSTGEGRGGGEPSWLSPTLVQAIEETLGKNEQTALFLNRRGYAPLTICRDCGHRIQCPNCTAWMTEHKKHKSLICHQCGHSISFPKVCPDCKSETGLTACGPGVERIAEEVAKRFPGAKIAILSSDITSGVKEVSEVIAKMEKGEVDILIGTQILAKGHHFPSLTLVGIVDADLGLIGSDLRAAEKTFQLLSQVSGRAGRGAKKGTVYVQTLYPENAVLSALVSNDREKFLSLEKHSRRLLKMPPMGKLASIIISGSNLETVDRFARHLASLAPNTDSVITLGPAPAPIFMLRGKYRFRLLIKTAKNIKIQHIIKTWLAKIKTPSNIRIEVDIDPYSFN